MTREEAIKAFRGLSGVLLPRKYYREAIQMAISALQQPEVLAHGEGELSAQPEPHWIPVTERLPEKYGEYRITWTTSASKKRLVGDSEYEVTSEWDDKRNGFKGEWLLADYIKEYPDVVFNRVFYRVAVRHIYKLPFDGGEGRG